MPGPSPKNSNNQHLDAAGPACTGHESVCVSGGKTSSALEEVPLFTATRSGWSRCGVSDYADHQLSRLSRRVGFVGPRLAPQGLSCVKLNVAFDTSPASV